MVGYSKKLGSLSIIMKPKFNTPPEWTFSVLLYILAAFVVTVLACKGIWTPTAEELSCTRDDSSTKEP